MLNVRSIDAGGSGGHAPEAAPIGRGLPVGAGAVALPRSGTP